MWEVSPGVDQKCAVRSYLLIALTIDEMEGMNKNPVILSKKFCRRCAEFTASKKAILLFSDSAKAESLQLETSDNRRSPH